MATHAAPPRAPLVRQGPCEGGGQRGMLLLYLLIHLGALGCFWCEFTLIDGLIALAFLQVRGFCISAGYHRYLAHHAFKTSRWMQFLLAAGGCLALRGGPLWWVALHRHHHRHSDTETDVFTPETGFWWSYLGWLISGRYRQTNYQLIPDLERYPELRWLNRYWLLPPALAALLMLCLGGVPTLLVGFCLSSVLLFHLMAMLDAFNHSLGFRRYNTGDSSRNSFLLAILAMGEGWHNNHHHYQASARLGFYWWEVDGTYTVLRLLACVGLVRALRTPSAAILARRRLNPTEKKKAPAPTLTARGALLPASEGAGAGSGRRDAPPTATAPTCTGELVPRAVC